MARTKTDRVMAIISGDGRGVPPALADGTAISAEAAEGGAAALDGGAVTAEGGGRTIDEITDDIQRAKIDGGNAILRIGRGLMEAKALLPHGEWLPWLEERVEFSEATAQRFMRLAREWANPAALTDLGATKALKLLALPEGEREEFIAVPHTVDGEEKTVSEMTTRELEKALRERDEARKRAEQAETDLSAAREDARKKGNLWEQARADNAVMSRDNAELRDRVKELENKPTEVAVETVIDAEAVEKARAEGLAEGRKEAAAVEDKLAEAKKKQQAAENKLSNAEKELKETAKKRNEADVLLALEKEQTDKLRKELDAARAAKDGAATEDRALANLTAKQVGEGMNTLAQLMVKARDAGDGELEKLIREKFAAWLTGLDGMLKK